MKMEDDHPLRATLDKHPILTVILVVVLILVALRISMGILVGALNCAGGVEEFYAEKQEEEQRIARLEREKEQEEYRIAVLEHKKEVETLKATFADYVKTLNFKNPKVMVGRASLDLSKKRWLVVRLGVENDDEDDNWDSQPNWIAADHSGVQIELPNRLRASTPEKVDVVVLLKAQDYALIYDNNALTGTERRIAAYFFDAQEGAFLDAGHFFATDAGNDWEYCQVIARKLVLLFSE